MAIKKTDKEDKYANFVYEITQTELDEAKWLVEQGDFKDLDDFFESSRQAEINMMKRADAEKERKAKLRKKRREEAKKKKAA